MWEGRTFVRVLRGQIPDHLTKWILAHYLGWEWDQVTPVLKKKVTYCMTQERGKRSNERDKPLRFGNSKQAGLARRHAHNTQGRQHHVVTEELSAFRPFWKQSPSKQHLGCSGIPVQLFSPPRDPLKPSAVTTSAQLTCAPSWDHSTVNPSLRPVKHFPSEQLCIPRKCKEIK